LISIKFSQVPSRCSSSSFTLAIKWNQHLRLVNISLFSWRLKCYPNINKH
jgi:hypothetical protein